MDGIKLCAENEKNKKQKLEPLIQAVRIYSHDIGMEFCIEKCAMLVLKSGKQRLTDGVEVLGGCHHQRSGDKRKKIVNNISGKPESYSRKNYIAEELSKE